MNERLRFVAEYLKDEITMTELCHAFGVSRKTGYKLVRRYQLEGVEGLQDRSHAPRTTPQATREEVRAMILLARTGHPTWGPKKIRAWLTKRHPDVALPATSTIGELLKRWGLVVEKRRRRAGPRPSVLSSPFGGCKAANEVWCADSKGWFRTADGTRCDPLTITDGFSRFLLRCTHVDGTGCAHVKPVFEAAFREYGLPSVMRTDNGPPFASNALAGLSELSIWWTKLGIRVERIPPGRPDQNGRHERMHRTLQLETAVVPRQTTVEQQVAFDAFRHEYNNERPHEAISMRAPAELYSPSEARFPATVRDPIYPPNFIVLKVMKNGGVRWTHNRQLWLTETLKNELVGIEPTTENYWRVFFANVPLGIVDAAKGEIVKYGNGQEIARAKPPLPGKGRRGPQAHTQRKAKGATDGASAPRRQQEGGG